MAKKGNQLTLTEKEKISALHTGLNCQISGIKSKILWKQIIIIIMYIQT